ncbi:DoxX family protein [Chengkuizengella axinellae]|uniref:DoxX family protein n=1 Tax=Chengkuizengella axinellae TaxID=3064388 RepID=A0ABT9IZI1_9BACL|nr:DoxX family protein [Chengkuizengella sp. 2205SS18-9]MDP5274779.1 DoxX family protein [Chengkuizengella sp. 2205SS18-9]
MDILVVILEVILGLAFLGAGFSKLFGAKGMVEDFKRYQLPQWFLPFTGFVEALGAVAIIIGIWLDSFSGWGALLLAVTMFFAVLTHLVKVKDPVSKALPAFILFVLALIVVIANWSEMMTLF